MRLSKYLLPTLREVPSDAEIPSHQLMLRAGLIRKLASGVYSYLPLGLKVLKNIEKIVRDYPKKPYLADRGVPEHDVFARLSDSDYEAFYDSVCEAAVIARNAYDAETVQESAMLWRELFGNKFPEPPQTKDVIFTERQSDSRDIPGGRFA